MSKAFFEQQEKRGEEALARIDERVRKHFVAKYASADYRYGSEGTFLGIRCKSCGAALPEHHADTCAVPHVLELCNLKLVLIRDADSITILTVPIQIFKNLYSAEACFARTGRAR
jgi:hypothetical protein